MTPAAVLAWAAFAFVALRALRYLLAARVYLTCALREVEARPVDPEHLDPGELRILASLDAELAAAGFRPLGFGSVTASVTFFGGALATRVFVNERIPAYALVHRHMAPEHGNLVELDVRTALDSGEQIVTGNVPFSSAFVPPGMHIEALPRWPVVALVERHAARVEAAKADGGAGLTAAQAHSLDPFRRIPESANLQEALNLVAATSARLRNVFRERNWVVPTPNPRLDRFTLRGAFALARQSLRGVGATRSVGAMPTSLAPPAVLSDSERSVLIEADLLAILHVAEHPEAAPGTPWPLLTVVAGTAALSFIAMAALWDAYVAALILAVITFHEAGHATAMRLFGYRDVHVFFVPLLGAMTVGRPAVTSVRDRLSVLFAGPVPGLWLAVVLLAIDQTYGPSGILRSAAIALLILNALNLLPFTPLDGGRLLEALTRPESVWRLVVQGVSAAGLLALAAILRDPIVAVIGLFWAGMLPKTLASYKLRRAVAAAAANRRDFRDVARTALEVMTAPPYTKWGAVTRQATARAIARLFAESLATPADRRWGVVAYAAAWLPVAVAVMLWKK